jgi:DNA-directed RNA polymerase subunit RPC12/RpoP
MSDLKFSCPSCGQHIQCPEDHAGENIPCPECAHLIRVPVSATLVPQPSEVAAHAALAPGDESKVSYTATVHAGD